MSERVTHVSHVAALFHTAPVLTPMSSVALAHVKEHCRAKGLAIVGLYSANARAHDVAKVSLTVQTLVPQLVPAAAAASSARLVLLLDDAKLGGANDFAFLRCAEKGDEWRAQPADATNTSDVPAVRVSFSCFDLWRLTARVLQCARVWLASRDNGVVVSDFDAHLEDAAADWTNAGVVKEN